MGKPKSKKKIMVIDDDRPSCYILRRELTGNGYDVKAVYGAQGCLKKLSKYMPDLVLLGRDIPESYDYEILRGIRSSSDRLLKTIPVILTSPTATKEDVWSTIQNGADDYLLKPFETPRLLKKIEKLLSPKHNKPLV